MKKLLVYFLAIILVSCNNTDVTPQEAKKEQPENITNTAMQKAAEVTPQITATFKGQTLQMVGKIMEQCDEKSDCSSAIIVKQKNTTGDNMYELVLEMQNKIAEGSYTLTPNFMGTFIDGVNLITKGEENNKYTVPTTYKQKGGSITLTSLTNKMVNGSFTFLVYKIGDTTAVETIQGTIKDLPIKGLGE